MTGRGRIKAELTR